MPSPPQLHLPASLQAFDDRQHHPAASSRRLRPTATSGLLLGDGGRRAERKPETSFSKGSEKVADESGGDRRTEVRMQKRMDLTNLSIGSSLTLSVSVSVSVYVPVSASLYLSLDTSLDRGTRTNGREKTDGTRYKDESKLDLGACFPYFA